MMHDPTKTLAAELRDERALRAAVWEAFQAERAKVRELSRLLAAARRALHDMLDGPGRAPLPPTNAVASAGRPFPGRDVLDGPGRAPLLIQP